MESDRPKPANIAGLFLNLVLSAAALCLWGPLLLFALLWTTHGSEGAYGLAVALLQMGTYACPAGAVMVALYAALVRPWRRPAAQAWFFWMQVLAVAMIGFAAGSFLLDDWRDGRQHAARQALIDQSIAQERQMDVTLLSDDVTTFAPLYQACGEYHCPRLPWVRKAVVARAPRILGLLLKGVTPGSSDADNLGSAANIGVCRDGIRYDTYASVSNLAGASGNLAIIDQLMPLWDGDQLQQAFDGAALGNQADAMRVLADRGVNPKAAIRKPEFDDDAPTDQAIAFAVSTGAVDALKWLADHGAQVQDDRQKHGLWVEFGQWVHRTPPEVWSSKLDPMLDALARLDVHPGHNQSEPLWLAIDTRNARLIHALMRHGARAQDVDDPERQAGLQSLLAGQPDAPGEDDGRDVRHCQTDAVE